jgi:serine/threonine protein kinase
MEFSDDGDLYQKILKHQKEETQFAEDDIWKVLIQVAWGLQKLHSLNILHRDLKVLVF